MCLCSFINRYQRHQIKTRGTLFRGKNQSIPKQTIGVGSYKHLPEKTLELNFKPNCFSLNQKVLSSWTSLAENSCSPKMVKQNLFLKIIVVIEMAIPFLSCHAMSNYFQMLFEQLRIPNTCQFWVQLILFRVLLLQSCYITIQIVGW